MKDGKAAGDDGITTEMFKLVGEFGTDKLTELYNDIYDTGYLPEDLPNQYSLLYQKNQERMNVETTEPSA